MLLNFCCFRCLIFGTDGLWNMISPSTAVSIVQAVEQNNAMSALSENPREKSWKNPSITLVEQALERWSNTRMRADNTTAVTLLLDPPGPPRDTRNINKNQQQRTFAENQSNSSNLMPESSESVSQSQEYCERENINENPYPATGLEIVTRYTDQQPQSSMGPSSSKPQYTEEYLDKLHKEYYSSLNYELENSYIDENDEPITSTSPKIVNENIQSNVVSSSSDTTKKLINTKSKKGVSKKSVKSVEPDPEMPSTSNVSTTKSEVKSKKLKVLIENSEKSVLKSRERRCKSLGPPDLETNNEKLRSRLSESVFINNTRFLRSSVTESVNKSCDIERKSSFLLKNQKYYEENSKNYLENINNVSDNNRSRSLGPKEIQTIDVTQKITRSTRLNQSLITFNDEVNYRLRRSQSMGPRDLTNVKNNQKTKVKNKSSDFIVINKKDSTKEYNKSNVTCERFVSKSPRTRSQGLIEVSDRKKCSNTSKQDVSTKITRLKILRLCSRLY